MKIFKFNEQFEIACESQRTRSGFRHVAILHSHGEEVDRTKVCYLNRTWESFAFQTVLYKILQKNKFTSQEQENFMKSCSEKSHSAMISTFNTIASVAMIGDIISDTQKDRVKWKERMVKAGLPLEFPEDWDSLTDEDKEARLNLVIEQLRKKE